MRIWDSAPRVRFHGLFFDALSEEFRPPQDTMGRIHTLGRLAHSAATKGRIVVGPQGGVEAGRINAFYNPSWAPGINTDVYGDLIRDVALVDMLSLESQGSDELMLGLQDEKTLTINDTSYVLELGERLVVARAAVAEAAQDFFDRAAAD